MEHKRKNMLCWLQWQCPVGHLDTVLKINEQLAVVDAARVSDNIIHIDRRRREKPKHQVLSLEQSRYLSAAAALTMLEMTLEDIAGALPRNWRTEAAYKAMEESHATMVQALKKAESELFAWGEARVKVSANRELANQFQLLWALVDQNPLVRQRMVKFCLGLAP